MKIFIKHTLLLTLLLVSSSVIAKKPIVDKLAQYSIGERGSANFELFSFYTKKGRYHSKIEYSYGKDEKTLSLRYLGVSKVNGKKAFKVKFANNYILTVIPQKNLLLKIKDKKGKYSKAFKWQYEGPINGRGTFCSVCADGEEAAMRIIKTYYLKKR